ncbi:hypothetical protein FYC51_02495 [Agromyces mariniharenae]|uniref:Uncharacterized protein n=1 Tax=Agromyces mariniharenae TaxID=2604423 RepID=A0A5S4V473_9MICO|nr:hypothetical protein FYC51_02495 [Agromyces mariniharenae]
MTQLHADILSRHVDFRSHRHRPGDGGEPVEVAAAGRIRARLGHDADATPARVDGHRHADRGRPPALAEPRDERGQGRALVVVEVGGGTLGIVDDDRDVARRPDGRGEVVEPGRLDARLERPAQGLRELAGTIGVGHRDAIGGHHAREERQHLASEHRDPALLHRAGDARPELGVASERRSIRFALPCEGLVDDGVRVAGCGGRQREHRRRVHGDERADRHRVHRRRRRADHQDRQHGRREGPGEQERGPRAVRGDREDEHADDDRPVVVVEVAVGADRRDVLGDRGAHRQCDDEPQPVGRERGELRCRRDRRREPCHADEEDAEHGRERGADLVPVGDGEQDRRREREHRADRDDGRGRDAADGVGLLLGEAHPAHSPPSGTVSTIVVPMPFVDQSRTAPPSCSMRARIEVRRPMRSSGTSLSSKPTPLSMTATVTSPPP